MKRASALFLPALFTIFILATVVLGEAIISAWPFFAEVTPRASVSGIYQFTVPTQVMDKAREDLADLRIYDANKHEVPYALRVRRDVDDSREVSGVLFNQVSVGATATEASVDLGEDHGEHNEVEIETAGANFRRLVDIEGSDSGKDWKTLGGDVIYSFGSPTNKVESKRASYVTSRYRYLRVRVFADQPREKTPPAISGVTIMMATREKGEFTTWDVNVPAYQLTRHEGAAASSWTFDLGGRVPCDRLLIDTEDKSFSRPFRIETIDDPQSISVVASGELTKRIGAQQALTIDFDTEVYARKLRLVVTDYSNPTLSISSVRASAPARQLYFELQSPAAPPLQLFFGNMNAEAPHYDFEKDLGAKLTAAPLSATLESYRSNPDYQPPPVPFTERVPWLIYIVLTISSAALALILLSLARATVRMDPAKDASS